MFHILHATIILDCSDLQLMEVIGQGSYGTVHVASWRGSLIAAKVVPVLMSEATSLAAEIDIMRYTIFFAAII